ncbi:M14 family zinc carboxypeptidase [Pedobacter sp.]|uniref:M14 family zinc carboxypeptidase n=1 Tax=Pedobacter sp. TaxID=1411316 RepID=UPI00396C3B52
MYIKDILSLHSSFKEVRLNNRFFKHEDIIALIKKLPATFKVKEAGKSVKGLSIHTIQWGNGPVKVMLWSQMHGDEATGTMTLFDLFNFLQSDHESVTLLANNCTLLFMPMVNPDGATVFTRRNAQQIDINRDYLQTLTPEAKILKQCRDDFEPHFGFNLHDQNTLWSVKGSRKPATLSYLAPAYDEALSVNDTRKNAMLVITEMFKHLNLVLPQQISLFDNEFEPRAFGDNFQKKGTSTILIEAGGYQNDFEKQEIRSFYFASILTGLISIASSSYQNQNTDSYFSIPQNTKQIFHILIKNIAINGIKTDIGINYEEKPYLNGLGTEKTYFIEDIGDLSYCDAYTVYHTENQSIEGDIVFNQNASFKLYSDQNLILSFTDGKLQ